MQFIRDPHPTGNSKEANSPIKAALLPRTIVVELPTPEPMSATHFICPGCGAEIRVGSKGCPKCTRTPKRKKNRTPKSWEQDESHDGLNLDLPEDDTFDYEKFVAEEFGAPVKRSAKQWIWWVTAVILLIVLFYLWV